MKRTNQVIECDHCGKQMQQQRWWQRFCSRECRQAVINTRVSELKQLRRLVSGLEAENRMLADKVSDLESRLQNALRNERSAYQLPTKAFRYDDEDQSQGWQEG